MADRIAIIGGQPYKEWIKHDGQAQRLYTAYLRKWPHGTTPCATVNNELYIRADNGMRRVHSQDQFDMEGEWCAQCGTPIDLDHGEYYTCDAYDCWAALCEQCGDNQAGDGHYCPKHQETFTDTKQARYDYPYEYGDGNQFTYGIEIELESALSDDFIQTVATSDIIAGWTRDASLEHGGIELQTNILDMSRLSALRQIVQDIPERGENAGGHIHVARTPNQCASRWYWALRGLNVTECRLLNMRHLDDDRWCTLHHGEYAGKHTAVNDEHSDTIELRTFDCWYAGTVDKLIPAVKWVRAMWRFFEKHARGTVSANMIEQYSACMADNLVDMPFDGRRHVNTTVRQEATANVEA